MNEEKALGLVGKTLGDYQITEFIRMDSDVAIFIGIDIKMGREAILRVREIGVGNGTILHKAQDLAQLEHENIVQVYQSYDADGYNVIAMAKVNGSNLAVILNSIPKGEFMEINQALHIFFQVCDAVRHLHENKCYAGELDPEDIQISIEGKVYLTGVYKEGVRWNDMVRLGQLLWQLILNESYKKAVKGVDYNIHIEFSSEEKSRKSVENIRKEITFLQSSTLDLVFDGMYADNIELLMRNVKIAFGYEEGVEKTEGMQSVLSQTVLGLPQLPPMPAGVQVIDTDITPTGIPVPQSAIEDAPEVRSVLIVDEGVGSKSLDCVDENTPPKSNPSGTSDKDDSDKNSSLKVEEKPKGFFHSSWYLIGCITILMIFLGLSGFWFWAKNGQENDQISSDKSTLVVTEVSQTTTPSPVPTATFVTLEPTLTHAPFFTATPVVSETVVLVTPTITETKVISEVVESFPTPDGIIGINSAKQITSTDPNITRIQIFYSGNIGNIESVKLENVLGSIIEYNDTVFVVEFNLSIEEVSESDLLIRMDFNANGQIDYTHMESIKLTPP